VIDGQESNPAGSRSAASGYKRFFAELKRRKVFQVAAVYGAGMFGVLQGADILVQALHLPESLVTLAAVVGLLGFPVALFVAWVFERSPDGLVRTEDAAPGELTQIIAAPPAKRWPVGLAAAGGTALLLVGAWLVLGRPAADAASQDDSVGAVAAGASADATTAVSDLSIAVLPFEDMSEAGDKEYFSDGLSEELIDALARVDNLQVAARTSSFAFKDGSADIRSIADSLGVANVLEGSVRASGDRLRITAQLIQASDGFHLWTETYDRELTDVFEVQEEIADAIATALLGRLGLEHGADFSVARTDIKAYEQYLLGRAFVSQRGDALLRAEEHFRAALAIDSMYAPAWGGLAEVYALYPYYASVDFEESLASSEEAARRALALDPNSANAHVALGSVLRERRQWKDAERELRRAVQLAPESSEAHGELSQYLLAVGEFDEAMDAARRSLALDPLSHHKLGLVGVYGLAARHYEEAEEVLWRVRGFTIAPISLTQFLAYEGRFDEAERAARIEPSLEDLLTSMVAAARAEPGSLERQRGLELVGGDARLPMAQGGGPMQAIWLVILGDEEQALDQLEELFEGPVIGLEVIGMPMFDPIRDHPRFQAIIEGLNLPE
jgi:TolB-like protein